MTPDAPRITRGDSPLILAIPHAGTWLPEDIFVRLNPTGQALADTDWHLPRLYAGLAPGATLVETPVHRYVIDANRDPSGASLYPGQNTTGLVPETDFDGLPIWRDGQAPGPDEIAERTRRWHAPYHAALSAEVERLRARHGFALLYDCHSIRSVIPFLFPGTLPDLNFGTNSGASCDADLAEAIFARCTAATGFTAIRDGRFKGGWTTRHYGRPTRNVHAVQMEIAQSAYMREAPPWDYLPDRADRLRRTLGAILNTLLTWSPA